jgi:hypothetical protein
VALFIDARPAFVKDINNVKFGHPTANFVARLASIRPEGVSAALHDA